MIRLVFWQAALLSLGLATTVALLIVWWRQRGLRWWTVLAVGVAGAATLSWWSGVAFRVADYRAGCDGLCPGFRGAPIPFYLGEAAGGKLLAGGFLLNSLVYLVILLGWAAVARGVVYRADDSTWRGRVGQSAAGLGLFLLPLALSPLVLPPPEAHVRGDSQRIAINARREVFMYDQMADLPVLRVGLDDVRPRGDGQPGMRVCLRVYTFFYLPTGSMFLDMTPEGVHSNNGGVLPRAASCWN